MQTNSSFSCVFDKYTLTICIWIDLISPNLRQFRHNPRQPTGLPIVIVIVRQLAQHQHDQRTQHAVQQVQRLNAILRVPFAKVTATQFHHLRPEIIVALDVLARHVHGVLDDGVETHQQFLESLGELAIASPWILAEIESDDVVVAFEGVVKCVDGNLERHTKSILYRTK